MPLAISPALERVTVDGAAFWTDPALVGRGVRIAFTERGGGVSRQPYASLDLAAHVGDDPAAVDENRTRLLSALGLAHARARLVMSEQVHGERVGLVDASCVGAGAYADHGPAPVQGTDALITSVPDVPLAMCFADCVPVVLVAPGPAIAVVHAGWRGALCALPGTTAAALASHAQCETADLLAYVGPHIRACHYETSDEILSQFVNTFGTLSRAESGGLDLGAVVNAALTDVGVSSCHIASLGACTAEETERFFSYRAEGGLTGRHGAVACILT